MLNIATRKKIIEARKNGMSVQAICSLYGAGKTAVYRLLRQERECGEITPRTHLRGRKPTLSPEQIEEIRQLVLEYPTLTLSEIRARLDLQIGIASISRVLHNKLGFRYKNKQYVAPEKKLTRV